ncbi:MAG: Alkaline phosphatase synthesis sensor protein PhoR [bacterium ADurb.Bin429]|nr:MAG: Alkaline phosphatase synthesis sensor protein PhoR [bacterium ADurb.Bin429]
MSTDDARQPEHARMDSYEMQVTRASERLTALAEEAKRAATPSRLLQETLAELSAALEELHVSGEEMAAQNEELAESRRLIEEERLRYQELFDLAPDAYLVTGITGVINEANGTALSIFGYARTDLLGLPLSTLIHYDDQRAFLNLLTDLRMNRRISTAELTMRTRGGNLFPAALTIAPARNGNNSLIGWRWIVRDVTERHRMLEALRAAKDELEARVLDRTADLTLANAELDATITCIADGVLVLDAHGCVIRANPAVEALTGYSTEQLRLSATELSVLLRPYTPDGKPLPPRKMPIARALDGELVRNDLLMLHHADGRELWVTVGASPIRDDDRVLGAVITFTDVSRLHELEEHMRMVLHTVSHDLRTPMAIIQGHTELIQAMLAGHDVPAQVPDSLDAVLRAMRRMTVMVNDLVDSTRIESDQLVLQRDAIAVAEYLAELCERLKTSMDVARVTLAIPADLPPVYADYNRLERILVNLLSNALKYSAPGTPVRVSARVEDDMVAIAVSDEGPGISPKDLPHLFERFYRAKGARKSEGLGLGLYITRLLVEAHDGHIRVDSTPGKGSTFTVSLPIAPNA